MLRDIACLVVGFFSDVFDFAADGCLGKPVFGSNAGGLPLLLGVFVESSNAVNVEAVAAVDVEAAATVDAVAGKSLIKSGKIC